jgi:methyl-accepting chemotaxis protein
MLAQLVPDIQKTSDLVKGITAASKEQAIGADQINEAIQRLSTVIQQNVSAAEALSSTAVEVGRQAEKIQSAIAVFKVQDLEAAGTVVPPLKKARHDFAEAGGTPPAMATPVA